jgi:hypothetical protein
MGQPITVVEKPGANAGTVRFELNRSLTGMGHQRYTSRATAVGPTPGAELARRLFDRGGVDAVHIYSNVVTVTLGYGGHAEGLADLVRDLFLYYREGVTPPTI